MIAIPLHVLRRLDHAACIISIFDVIAGNGWEPVARRRIRVFRVPALRGTGNAIPHSCADVEPGGGIMPPMEIGRQVELDMEYQ
jgi:hypothetical protein